MVLKKEIKIKALSKTKNNKLSNFFLPSFVIVMIPYENYQKKSE